MPRPGRCPRSGTHWHFIAIATIITDPYTPRYENTNMWNCRTVIDALSSQPLPATFRERGEFDEFPVPEDPQAAASTLHRRPGYCTHGNTHCTTGLIRGMIRTDVLVYLLLTAWGFAADRTLIYWVSHQRRNRRI